MLNKDQYNQEEYNNYYRQEVEGSEIGGSEGEEGGLMSKLLILLVILALAIAGYFGYKAMNNPADDIDESLKVSAESSLPMSVQEDVNTVETTPPTVAVKEETVKAETPAPVAKAEKSSTVQSTVDNEVAKAVAKTDMSAEQIQAIVAAVMEKVSQKDAAGSTSVAAVKQDAELMDKLSDTQVDSVSSDLISELENINVSENTQVNNNQKQVDVYNKVNVQDASGADTLSQLSDEINAVMNEEITTNKVESYTESLKSEVDVRQNEMRIIVVRKGDTLGKIAKRAYGNVMDFKKIYKANPEVTRPDRIYIGQKLRIPNE